MRINGIQVDGYGVIRDVKVSAMQSGLLLFYGDNEAGKSTFLEFLRGMLFGFPRLHENEFPFVAGAPYGGRLLIASDRSGSVVLDRRPGKGGGTVTMGFGDGRKGSDPELQQLLGYTSPQLFRNIYAFSLGELQELKTLRDDAVKAALYGASVGAAMKILPETMRNLDRTMAELFAPGGRNRPINACLSALEEARSRLRDAKRDSREFEELSAGRCDADREIEALSAEVSVKRRDLLRTETYIKLWAEWIRLLETEERLEGLQEIADFPENGLVRLEQLLVERRGARDGRSKTQSELDAARARADRLALDERMITADAEIRWLARHRSEYDSAAKALVKDAAEIEVTRREIARILDGLGPAWTEDTLTAIDRSLFTVEAIQGCQVRLGELDSGESEAARAILERRSELVDARREKGLAREEFDRYGEIDPDYDEEIQLKLQRGSEQFASVVRDLPRLGKECEDARRRLIGIVAEISPEWSVEQVKDFDSSLPSQAAVVRMESDLDRAGKEVSDSSRDASVAKEQVRHLEEERVQWLERRDRLSPGSSGGRRALEARRSSLRGLSGLLARRRDVCTELTHLEERMRDREEELARHIASAAPTPLNARHLRAAALVSALSGLSSGVAYWWTGHYPTAVVIGSGLLVLAAVLWVAGSRLRSLMDADASRNESLRSRLASVIQGIRDESDRLADRRDELGGTIEALVSELGFVGEPVGDAAAGPQSDSESWLRYVAEQERIVEAGMLEEEERERIGEEILRIDRKIEAGRSTLAAAELRSVEMEERLDRTRESWEQWLSGARLAPGTSPLTARLLFQKVETAKDQADKIAGLQQRIAAMELARDEHLNLARQIPSLARTLGNRLDEAASSIDVFLDQSRRRAKELEDRRIAEQVLHEKVKLADTAERKLGEAEEKMSLVRGCLEAARNDWCDFLRRIGIPADVAPSTALEALRMSEKCTDLINRRNKLASSISEGTRIVTDYRSRAQDVLRILGRESSSLDGIPAAVEAISTELENALATRKVADEIEGQMIGLVERLRSEDIAAASIDSEIAGLLQAGQATDEEDFRRRSQIYRDTLRLREQAAQCRANLRTIAGIEDWSSLRSRLEVLDRDELAGRQADATRGIAELEDALQSLRQQKADLGTRMDRLSSADTISQIRAEEEEALADLRSQAARWSTCAIAQHLIKEARKRFEQDRQPAVVRDAGGFFRRMTGGRYQSVVCPLGEDTFEVVSQDGGRRRPEELSRGAAEQLYLAIRFGYILNYTANGERLPVIMDDILVNFDPERARLAGRVILELSKTHQILFFTCHPETVGFFRDENPLVPLYRISDGGVELSRDGHV